MSYLPPVIPDEQPFTAGASPVVPGGGVFNDSLAALTSGQQGEGRITPARARHVNLRNQAGTEIATAANPARVDPTGTTKQPVLLYDAAGNAITSTSSALDQNFKLIGGTAVDTNSGNKSAGTQRMVLATDQPALANWRENVTYSDGAIKPRFIGNRTLNVAVNSGSGTLVPALAGNYIYIAAIQLVISPASTQTIAGDWNVLFFDGAAIIWFNRLHVPSAFTGPNTTLVNGLETPSGFFYNSQNINSAITWSVSNTLLTGGISAIVSYGYTTLLF